MTVAQCYRAILFLREVRHSQRRAARYSQRLAVPPGAGEVLGGSEAQAGGQRQAAETPVVPARRCHRAHGLRDPGVAA